MGIDPGLSAMGYGVVERTGSRFTPLGWGVIRSKGTALSERLLSIHQALDRVLSDHQPQVVAVEEIFTGINPRGALLMGHARGVVLLTAALRGYEVREFPAKSVKQAVVGRGSAAKQQVEFMVKKLLNIADKRIPHDASDALAVGICCLLKIQSSAAAPVIDHPQ